MVGSPLLLFNFTRSGDGGCLGMAPSEQAARAGAVVTLAQAELQVGLGGLGTGKRTCSEEVPSATSSPDE